MQLIEDPSKTWSIADGQSVGRDERADVILAGAPKLNYISGKMARFCRRGEQWFIQHLGHTNYIEVDGTQYDDDSEVALEEGSIVGLPLTFFRIHLGGNA